MAHIQIRISDEEKKMVQEAFQKMGMNMSSGIKLFLRRVAVEKKMPFEIVETAFPKKLKKTNVLPKTEKVEIKKDLVEKSEEIEKSEAIEMIEFEKKEKKETLMKQEKKIEEPQQKKSSNFSKWNLFEKHKIG